MHHREFATPAELQDIIKCFWHNTRDAGAQQSAFEVQPDGYAEIIFYFGNLSGISPNGDLQPLPSPFMMGLLNQPAVFYTQNRLEIIAVRCYPWTVFNLLGLLSGKGGVRIFEHPIAGLHAALSKLVGAGRIDEAIDHIKQYFLDARQQIASDSTLFKAGRAIRDANGAMPVSGVASAAHATVRTLERKFKRSSGYSVKDISGLIRFEQARNQLWQQPDTSLTSLAHQLGYTDQAHLSREFKRYSGIPPAAFARKAKKDKQDLGSDFVAFIQA